MQEEEIRGRRSEREGKGGSVVVAAAASAPALSLFPLFSQGEKGSFSIPLVFICFYSDRRWLRAKVRERLLEGSLTVVCTQETERGREARAIDQCRSARPGRPRQLSWAVEEGKHLSAFSFPARRPPIPALQRSRYRPGALSRTVPSISHQIGALEPRGRPREGTGSGLGRRKRLA